MKTRLIVVLLAAATLLCSCRKLCDGCGHRNCIEVVKPADLKPIDWDGWNDAYTLHHTFHDKSENAQVDYCGDTIRCYGHISKYLYEDYPSLSPDGIYFECSDAAQAVAIWFSRVHGIDKDSLVQLLNSSSYSDTCFVKGIFGFWVFNPMGCEYVNPAITVTSIDDIYFKRQKP